MEGCSSVASLEPLHSLPKLTNLSMIYCEGLPYDALHPLSTCTALKQLDIRDSGPFDLTPLASCPQLRRLWISPRQVAGNEEEEEEEEDGQPDLVLSPLQGLAGLEIREGAPENSDSDAEDL
jgi:hypothetical protein